VTNYDSIDDVWKSVAFAYEVIREREKNGGPGWSPGMSYQRKETLAEGIELYLGDCRQLLPILPRVDAVVTDPAYGVNAARDRHSQKWGWRDYECPGWDKERTPPEVVALAVKAGKNAIVWGGNYWTDVLGPTSKWLVWDKGQSDFSLADVELAWCSFEGAARRLFYPRAKAMQDGKEHPTQKALAVMRWTIEQLPAPANTILDPFCGSGTTGVAAVKLGRRFTGIEVHEPYFDIACRRISEALKQPDLFIEKPKPPKQEALL
jgi:DNA modification methylase